MWSELSLKIYVIATATQHTWSAGWLWGEEDKERSWYTKKNHKADYCYNHKENFQPLPFFFGKQITCCWEYLSTYIIIDPELLFNSSSKVHWPNDYWLASENKEAFIPNDKCNKNLTEVLGLWMTLYFLCIFDKNFHNKIINYYYKSSMPIIT